MFFDKNFTNKIFKFTAVSPNPSENITRKSNYALIYFLFNIEVSNWKNRTKDKIS